MPADQEPTPIELDGIWRPEPWTNGRFLVTRYVELEGRPCRQLHKAGEFSAFANVYEDEESAAAEAERLNKANVAAMLKNSSLEKKEDKA